MENETSTVTFKLDADVWEAQLYTLAYFIELFLSKKKTKRIGEVENGSVVGKLYEKIQEHEAMKEKIGDIQFVPPALPPASCDLVFLGGYPVILQDDDESDFQMPDDMEDTQDNIDYAKYEEDLRQAASFVGQGGYLATPLGYAYSYREKRLGKLAEKWEQCGLFLRLIVNINGFRNFFVLQVGGEKPGKYAILKLSVKDYPSGQDSKQEPKIIEKAMRIAYESTEGKHNIDSDSRTAQGFRVKEAHVRNIDSDIRYRGSIVEVKRMQDERDAVGFKQAWDFQEIQCDTMLKNNPEESDVEIDTTFQCLYVPKESPLFAALGEALEKKAEKAGKKLEEPGMESAFLPVSVGLLETYEKICTSGLRYSAFDLNGIEWYEYCRKINEECCKARLSEAALKTPWDHLEYGPWMLNEEGDWAYTEDVWGEPDWYPALLGMPEAVLLKKNEDDGVKEDGIYSRKQNGEYELIQSLDREDKDPEADYTLFQRILSEIMKKNLLMIRLDDDIVSGRFFELYLQTLLGRKFLREWAELSKKEGVLVSFKQMRIYLPSLERQTELLEIYESEQAKKSAAERKIRQTEKMQSTIKEFIGGTEKFTPCAPKPSAKNKEPEYPAEIKDKVGKKPNPLLEGMETLPQPLAAILYLDSCEDNITKRIINLVHFLEAAAIFHATVMLSVLHFLDKEKECDYSKLILGNKFSKVKNTLEQPKSGPASVDFEFGNWTHMIGTIMGKYENRRKEKGKKAYREFFYSVPNRDLVDVLLSQELLEKLQVGRNARNERFAHAERQTRPEEEKLYKDLNRISSDIKEKIQKVYSGIRFIYEAKKESDSQGIDRLKGYDFSGANPRPVYREIPLGQGTELPENISGLHILLGREPIPMLPFIVVEPLAKMDSGLLCSYLLFSMTWPKDKPSDKDKKWGGDAKWHSFACGEVPILSSKSSNRQLDEAKQLVDMMRPKLDSQNHNFR